MNGERSGPAFELWLVRHGETTWAASGRHTGRTDIPLTERGEREARGLRARLGDRSFDGVLTSPLVRASRTCELAGFLQVAEVDADLAEWDYGACEGMTTEEIHARQPGWDVFRDGCPGGESPAAVSARADRVLDRVRSPRGAVLLFSHAHFLRVLAARWLGLDPAFGRCFTLDTASISMLGTEHDGQDAVIRLWNDCRPGEEAQATGPAPRSAPASS